MSIWWLFEKTLFLSTIMTHHEQLVDCFMKELKISPIQEKPNREPVRGNARANPGVNL